MNRISKTLKEKDNILSIYFTAGFPELNSTIEIIKNLVSAGVDMIEIGLPFSDPLADGETIQMSSKIALDNGISTNILFEQLKEIRNHVNIPLIIMGYFNPIFQFGVEEFCKKCNEIGIDGLIIPDLPIDIYISNYKIIFEEGDWESTAKLAFSKKFKDGPSPDTKEKLKQKSFLKNRGFRFKEIESVFGNDML